MIIELVEEDGVEPPSSALVTRRSLLRRWVPASTARAIRSERRGFPDKPT